MEKIKISEKTIEEITDYLMSGEYPLIKESLEDNKTKPLIKCLMRWGLVIEKGNVKKMLDRIETSRRKNEEEIEACDGDIDKLIESRQKTLDSIDDLMFPEN